MLYLILREQQNETSIILIFYVLAKFNTILIWENLSFMSSNLMPSLVFKIPLLARP